jgi:hypothetical protein
MLIPLKAHHGNHVNDSRQKCVDTAGERQFWHELAVYAENGPAVKGVGIPETPHWSVLS